MELLKRKLELKQHRLENHKMIKKERQYVSLLKEMVP